ncbi:MAG: enoyl-CoA hydratase [Alphaproteobacteria bacterium]
MTIDSRRASDHGTPRPVLRRDMDGVATLTLNRPDARNALSLATMAALQAELDRIAVDPAVRAVVLAGAGSAFCAGHDLKEMRANPDRAFYERTFSTCSRLMMSLMILPQPVIARVHGIATAAGCQLVATADLAIASTAARFATPGVQIGLFCSTPMVALSRNVGRKAAMEMLLLGDPVSAERALEIGLVNAVVPPEDLDGAVARMTARLTAKSPLTLRIGKEAFYRQIEAATVQAYDLCSRAMTENMLAQDAAEGIDAFLEKREPKWSGS